MCLEEGEAGRMVRAGQRGDRGETRALQSGKALGLCCE